MVDQIDTAHDLRHIARLGDTAMPRIRWVPIVKLRDKPYPIVVYILTFLGEQLLCFGYKIPSIEP